MLYIYGFGPGPNGPGLVPGSWLDLAHFVASTFWAASAVPSRVRLTRGGSTLFIPGSTHIN